MRKKQKKIFRMIGYLSRLRQKCTQRWRQRDRLCEKDGEKEWKKVIESVRTICKYVSRSEKGFNVDENYIRNKQKKR